MQTNVEEKMKVTLSYLIPKSEVCMPHRYTHSINKFWGSNKEKIAVQIATKSLGHKYLLSCLDLTT